jgi:hypothetical protein
MGWPLRLTPRVVVPAAWVFIGIFLARRWATVRRDAARRYRAVIQLVLMPDATTACAVQLAAVARIPPNFAVAGVVNAASAAACEEQLLTAVETAAARAAGAPVAVVCVRRLGVVLATLREHHARAIAAFGKCTLVVYGCETLRDCPGGYGSSVPLVHTGSTPFKSVVLVDTPEEPPDVGVDLPWRLLRRLVMDTSIGRAATIVFNSRDRLPRFMVPVRASARFRRAYVTAECVGGSVAAPWLCEDVLVDAVCDGNVDAVCALLRDCDYGARGAKEFAEAAWAVSCTGHEAIFRVLLASSREYGWEPSLDSLRWAARVGLTAIVRALLSDGRVHPALAGNIVLREAVNAGQMDVLQVLLADGRVDFTANDNHALHYAVVSNDVGLLQALAADRRVDLAVCNPLMCSAAMRACIVGTVRWQRRRIWLRCTLPAWL